MIEYLVAGATTTPPPLLSFSLLLPTQSRILISFYDWYVGDSWAIPDSFRLSIYDVYINANDR